MVCFGKCRTSFTAGEPILAVQWYLLGDMGLPAAMGVEKKKKKQKKNSRSLELLRCFSRRVLRPLTHPRPLLDD